MNIGKIISGTFLNFYLNLAVKKFVNLRCVQINICWFSSMSKYHMAKVLHSTSINITWLSMSCDHVGGHMASCDHEIQGKVVATVSVSSQASLHISVALQIFLSHKLQ